MHGVQMTRVAEAHGIKINHGVKSGGYSGCTLFLYRWLSIEDTVDTLCSRKAHHPLVEHGS